MESIEETVDLALAGAGQLAQLASHCSLSVYQSIQSVRHRTPSVKNVITLTLFYFGSEAVRPSRGPAQNGTKTGPE